MPFKGPDAVLLAFQNGDVELYPLAILVSRHLCGLSECSERARNGISIGRRSGIRLTKIGKRSMMRAVEEMYNAARGSHQTDAR